MGIKQGERDHGGFLKSGTLPPHRMNERLECMEADIGREQVPSRMKADEPAGRWLRHSLASSPAPASCVRCLA